MITEGQRLITMSPGDSCMSSRTVFADIAKMKHTFHCLLAVGHDGDHLDFHIGSVAIWNDDSDGVLIRAQAPWMKENWHAK